MNVDDLLHRVGVGELDVVEKTATQKCVGQFFFIVRGDWSSDVCSSDLLPGLKKKPSTSELLDWLKLLVAEDIPLEALQSKEDKVAVPPLVGALLKNEQDVTLFEKLVFMQRHNR